MATRRQSEEALPERPRGVHEYRASLLSVFLHTDAQSALLGTITPELRPLPLRSALESIEGLPDDQDFESAQRIAGLKLSAAVLLEGKRELEPYLEQLLGVDAETLKESLLLPRIGAQPLNYETLRQAFYGRSGQELSREFRGRRSAQEPATPIQAPSQQASEPRPKPEEDAAKLRQAESFRREVSEGTQEALLREVEECFDEAAEQQAGSQPESRVDLRSLVTTVDISSTSNFQFAALVDTLDPRNWSRSKFWPESTQVELSETAPRVFTPVEVSRQTGPSWHGHLFEHVEWNWNLQRISAFRNFLEIHYDVDPAEQWIRLKFSLYSCEGSQLTVLQQRRGIDVDSGFQCVLALTNTSNPQGASFQLRTVKHVRFADLLDRRVPNQGPAGSGLFLSLLAPAFVGLWMNELLESIERTPS